MRIAIILSVASVVLVACHLYILRRFARRWVKLPRQRLILAGVMTLVLFLAASLGRLGIESKISDLVLWVAYTWMGAGLMLLVTGLCLDLYFLGMQRLGTRQQETEVDPSRRALLTGRAENIALGAAAIGTGVGMMQARGSFKVTRTEVPISGLPASFDGYKIVQVSDIHVGPTIKGSFVERMVDEINAQAADLVAITGDLVDGSLKHLSDHVRRLSKIKSQDGAFFVTGNHEYYSGAQVWVDFVKTLGIEPLMNEHRVIERDGERLVLAGVTDYSAHQHLPEHRSDVAAALEGADPSLSKILLAHQPRSVFEAADKGIDLQLSGHTHNGQMFPFNFFVAMAQPYLKGLAKVVESASPMWIYVHQGTGYWGPPNRLGIPPEVAVLTLRSA